MKKRIKFFLKTLAGIILVMKVETSFSQVLPLFNNGDFENRSSCPSNYGQVDLVNGLSSCTQSVDYFNTCGFKTNSCRTVTPFSGNGCIGMWGTPWNATGTQYESVVAVLDNPTVNGAQYDINFYLFGENNSFSPCSSPAPGSCFSFGFKFFKSSNPLLCNTGLFPIPAGTHPTPDVSIDGSTVITGSWNNYSLLYTADDVYDRVLFGWFPNASAYTSTCYNTDPKAYAYMDKLCMDAPGSSCGAVCNYSIDAVTSNSTICAGNAISLSGTVGGGVTTTSWTTSGTGNFSSTTALNTTYTPTSNDIAAGTVTLTVTTDDPAGSCTAKTDKVIVTISSQANTSINSAGPFCANATASTLTAAQSGGVWSGTGITNTNTGVFNPGIAGVGNHVITYSISGSCGGSSTTTIQVIANTIATITPVGSLCSSGNSVNLTASQAGGVWSGTGITNSVDGTFSPTTAGIGSHVVTYSISGTCGGSSTTTIQVTNKADASINASGPFCVSNSPLNLTAAQTGGVWSGTGITNSVDGTFSPNTAGAGTHTITYLINGNCGDTATVNIQVFNDANTTISPAGPFCSNSNTVNLTAAQTGGVWIGIGINSSTGVFDPSSVGLGNNVITYSISGTCGGSSTTTIQVNESDTASFTYADVKFCIPSLDPSPIILKTQGGVFSIDNGGVIDAQTGKISLEASGVGSYSVTYQTMGTTGCPDQSSVLITICGESSVSIPNVFSPNGDNVNDRFHIKGVNIKSIKTEIYNRWGTQMYAWDGIDGYWDGKTPSGELAAPGTYFYVTTIVDITDQTTTKNGFLTLIK